MLLSRIPKNMQEFMFFLKKKLDILKNTAKFVPRSSKYVSFV